MAKWQAESQVFEDKFVHSKPVPGEFRANTPPFCWAVNIPVSLLPLLYVLDY
ncbi:hypothetical protein A2U01_0101753, partial [Trifolium medium]|nr:hypothetical protein [Trifolium medium]